MKIPELRNYIYELMFSAPDATEVDLFEAKPPPKSLLLTCRQVYNEAAALYRAAYRSFWTESDFVMKDVANSDAIREKFSETINMRNYQNIAKLSIRLNNGGEMALLDGVWTGRVSKISTLFDYAVVRSGEGRDVSQVPGSLSNQFGQIGSRERDKVGVFILERMDDGEKALLRHWLAERRPRLLMKEIVSAINVCIRHR